MSISITNSKDFSARIGEREGWPGDVCVPMNTLFAMRRANGDWFALDDRGSFRVPVFHSPGDAMLARSRETGMECFKPVELDAIALTNLTTTDEGKACFWLVSDPLMKLSRGRALDRKQLKQYLNNGAGQSAQSGAGE